MSALSLALFVTVEGVVIASLNNVVRSLGQLTDGNAVFANPLDRMMLPNREVGFLSQIGFRILETFQIALVAAFHGLFGASGIGKELKVALGLFRYQNACVITLMIFVVVLVMVVITDKLRASIQ